MNFIRVRTLLTASVATLALFSATAFAHGSAPNSHQLTARLDTPSELWDETTFGLVVSRDNGATWDWICDQSTGFTGHVNLFVAADGKIFAAGFDGLFVSDDGGCSWSKSPLFADLSPSDIQRTPSDPTQLWITTSRYGNVNGLFRSTNGGTDWALTSLKSDKLLFTSVRVAPSNAQRMYVAAWWSVDTPATKLFRSDDGGGSFTEVDLTTALPQGAFTVWAVDPSNPDIVWGALTRSSAPFDTQILRSKDGGNSFEAVLSSNTALNGISLRPDGRTVLVGTDSGLFRSFDGGDNFETMPKPQRNVCPLRVGDDLYVTGSQLKDTWALAKSPDDGTSLSVVMHLYDIRGPLECPAGTATHDACPAYWPVTKASFPAAPDQPDAGSDQTDGGMTPPPPDPGGCHCGSAGGSSPWLISLFVLAAAVRARRSRSKPAS